MYDSPATVRKEKKDRMPIIGGQVQSPVQWRSRRIVLVEPLTGFCALCIEFLEPLIKKVRRTLITCVYACSFVCARLAFVVMLVVRNGQQWGNWHVHEWRHRFLRRHTCCHNININ